MKSDFQFTNPALLNIEFKLNPNFNPSEEEKIQIEVKTETEVRKNEENNSAYVVLKVTIGKENDEKIPFFVYAEEGAAFRWEGDTVYGNNPDKLLQQNAPALLLSYLRPTVALITAASPYTAYDIPFMNFSANEQSNE